MMGSVLVAEDVAFALNPEKDYAIIDVELY